MNVNKLRHCCEVMLASEKKLCIRYGTESVHGVNVRMLLDALEQGPFDDWVKNELLPARAYYAERFHYPWELVT